ncbi:MAG: HPF/RaiA family ribosome-associated protein [Gammaproteobacteria bacterium]|nr:HPF/RaiA family ribosome-associated protein [Gammaproteobacteria bacterium]
MKQPLEIVFRDMPASEFVEEKIREKAAMLDKFYDRIMSCRVVIELPHAHHNKGKLFHVTVDLTVPDGELVVNRSPKDNHAHEDVYVAIRDAFDAAKRQLQSYARKRRGDVKTHDAPAHGSITEIISGEDYGRIQTPDGRDIYFHRNSLVNADYDSLEEGDEVRFAEEEGEHGPQASSMHKIGKHHIVE